MTMSISAQDDISAAPSRNPLQTIPGWLLAGVPLILIQPIFTHIATHVAGSRPELFARLGPHVDKVFLIDPIDLPFVLLLRPNARRPLLKANRRSEPLPHDAAIAGTFLKLLGMIDGSLDGDALFFSRDLHIDGDIEAVVALRNALDDCQGSAFDSIVSAFGPLSIPLQIAISALRGANRK